MMTAPPMRIVHKGWFTHHELTYQEAEAYFLRLAGGGVGRREQSECLRQADANRAWAKRA